MKVILNITLSFRGLTAESMQRALAPVDPAIKSRGDNLLGKVSSSISHGGTP